jgi:proline iminopeptidase
VIAASYAAEFPEHVRALILAAPAPLFTMPANDPDLFAQVRERLPEHKRGDYDQYLAKYFDLRNHLDQSEAALSKYFGAFREFSRRRRDFPQRKRR